MDFSRVRALTFDTGGTVLDWHTGFTEALSKIGERHGEERDWPRLANDLRRRSLKIMKEFGVTPDPNYNFDNGHRDALDALLRDEQLEMFTEAERYYISYVAPHAFQCWPDFPKVQRELRKHFLCCPLTILSFRIVTDTARANDISWDAVFSCEAIGAYKPAPYVYNRGAEFLQLQPSEICMVAAHNFDLNAAKACGFKTAFIRRPREWGDEEPPEPVPNPDFDLYVDDFPTLLSELTKNR